MLNTHTNTITNPEINNENPSKDNQKSTTTHLSVTSNKYQPLSFETYKFFMKFAPVLEKLITNNINKYTLQSTSNEKVDLKQFLKVKDFILSEDLLNGLNQNKLQNNQVTFDGK
jgi:hypothetical protein